MVLSLFFQATAAAQSPGIEVITPRFEPARPRNDSAVIPAQFREILGKPGVVPPERRPKGVDETYDPIVRTDLPGPQRLFLRESEAQFFERLAQDMKKQKGGGRAIFPEDIVISKEPYKPRNFQRMTETVEPCYVCHGRLFWEQPNFERTGHSLGVLTPAVCLGVFYYDTLLLPYHAFSEFRNYDCNVGKCLPSDPAPLLLPRERFSVTGLVGQAGAITGIGFLFP